jgi:hypothetical protein
MRGYFSSEGMSENNMPFKSIRRLRYSLVILIIMPLLMAYLLNHYSYKKFIMAENKKNVRFVYHVTPDASAERWIVSLENADFRREFNTKEEAETFAKQRAQREELAQVKVHKRDGNMDHEATYGEYPRNIPG